MPFDSIWEFTIVSFLLINTVKLPLLQIKTIFSLHLDKLSRFWKWGHKWKSMENEVINEKTKENEVINEKIDGV